MSYETKRESYFHGERRDFVDQLPLQKLRFLEIGCGNGATAAYARATGRVESYVGVELFPDAAELAKPVMTDVIVGDIEKIDVPADHGPFDVLVMSEVLEHLVDPWRVLTRLKPLMRKGADVFASSPAVSHHSVIRMLITGRWDLTDFGRMDRTHLRWFTPKSYAGMFESCGYTVESVESMTRLSRKQSVIHALLPRRFKHLMIGQMKLHARVPTRDA